MGITYVYEAVTTVGSRVPNRDWKSVLNPETKSMVCITLAFSICDKRGVKLIKRMQAQKIKESHKSWQASIKSLHLLHPFWGQAYLELGQ